MDLIRTLRLRRNGYSIIVTATFYKGCKRTLETPAEPDWWFSDSFYIEDMTELSYEQILDLLQLDDQQFTDWIDEEFSNNYKTEFYEHD